MNKRIVYFVFVTSFTLFSTCIIKAQVDTLWTKTFGGKGADGGSSVQQTADEGYIIVGNTGSFGAGHGDVWLIKTDASGDTLWTKIYGQSQFDYGISVQQTTDGGYIVLGNTGSFSAGDFDVWLIKTNAFGDTLWTRTYGGSGIDWGYSIQQTTDGGYIIVGSIISINGNDLDIWLFKTDSSGDTIWTKTFGGILGEEGYSVSETTDGGYIITGISGFSFVGETDVYLIKTDDSGDTLWTRTYGASGNDTGWWVQQTKDEGYIIVGSTDFYSGFDGNVWLIKTDVFGDTLWTRKYGGSQSDYGLSVQQTLDSGYIIVAETNSFGAGHRDIWLIKTDAIGDTLWTKTVGGSGDDGARSIRQTTEGGFIIAGGTESFGAGSGDVWLIKTTPDVSSIERNNEIITLDFSLHQNFPNPFNPSTKITYSIPARSNVSLKVFDLLGSEIVELAKGEIETGTYDITFNADNLPSGVYFYRLQAGSFMQTRKMTVLK